MGTLPTDQPLRYDGPLGSCGREAGFLFHASIESTSIACTEDSQSLRWRSVAGAVCACSFHAPHVGIAVDVRVAFWRTFGCLGAACLASIISVAPCLLLETPTYGFTALLQIFQEIMDSRALVLRYPLDQLAHRCGSALDVILTTSTPVCQVAVQNGSRLLPWCYLVLSPPRVRPRAVLLPVVFPASLLLLRQVMLPCCVIGQPSLLLANRVWPFGTSLWCPPAVVTLPTSPDAPQFWCLCSVSLPRFSLTAPQLLRLPRSSGSRS